MADETNIPELEYKPADWLEPILGAEPVPEELPERCRLAGLAAYHIDSMRRMRANDEFVAMPFGQYVKGLADLARVSLAPMLATLRIEDLCELGQRAIPLLAKLARQLDITERDARNFLRLSVAESAGRDASVMVAAYKGGPTVQDACEKALTFFEAEYDEAGRQRLASVLAAIDEEYRPKNHA
jgi:hypothetical protein